MGLPAASRAVVGLTPDMLRFAQHPWHCENLQTTKVSGVGGAVARAMALRSKTSRTRTVGVGWRALPGAKFAGARYNLYLLELL